MVRPHEGRAVQRRHILASGLSAMETPCPALALQSEPFQILQIPDDGERSVGDFVTRPFSAPVDNNVYLANFEGGKYAAANWPGNGTVFNLSRTRSDDPRVNNTHAFPDESSVDEEQASKWLDDIADAIRDASKRKEWVVVNCKAGCNRSSAAVLHYMLSHTNYKSYNKALGVIKARKLSEAIRRRCKNRYQSFDPTKPTFNQFSWPTLQGGASKKFEKLIKKKLKNRTLQISRQKSLGQCTGP